MKSVFKTIFATCAAASAFAAQAAPQAPQAPMDPNPSARWGTNDKSNVFVTGEVVWFKPLQTQVAKTTVGQYDGSDKYNYHLKMFENNFQPGARVALGYNTSYDGWDAVLIYTGLRYKHNNSFLYDDNFNEEYVATGSTNYVFYYDQGDLDFGRMFKVSRKLKLRPHVGVRALWLTQKNSVKFNGEFESTDDYSSVYRVKSTLVGAEAGVDTAWMLSKEFCVYANLGFTTLVDSQKFIASQKDVTTQQEITGVKTNYGTKIVNGLDFAIGLRWDRNFSNGDYHFGINLGYEHHSLINLNTNLYNNFVMGGYDLQGMQSDYPAMSDQDFSLQGIALGVRFDF